MAERNWKAELRAKLVPTLIPAIFVIFGLVLLVSHGIRICKEAIPRLWTPVMATILSAKLRVESGERFLDVRYEYDFAGKRIVGTRFNPNGDRLPRKENEVQIWKLFPVGSVFTCRVNPRSPAESYLQTEESLANSILLTLFPLTFFALGSLALMAIWRQAPEKKARDERPGPRWISKAAWATFGLFSTVALYAVTLEPLDRPNQAQRWVEVPCTITLSEIGVTGEGSQGRKREGWYLAYAYSIDGQKRIGTQYDFSAGQPQGIAQLRKLAFENREGQKTVCYVNPEDPSEAVLSRGMTVHGIELVPPFLIFIGGIVFFIARRARLKKARARVRR